MSFWEIVYWGDCVVTSAHVTLPPHTGRLGLFSSFYFYCCYLNLMVKFQIIKILLITNLLFPEFFVFNGLFLHEPQHFLINTDTTLTSHTSSRISSAVAHCEHHNTYSFQTVTHIATFTNYVTWQTTTDTSDSRLQLHLTLTLTTPLNTCTLLQYVHL